MPYELSHQGRSEEKPVEHEDGSGSKPLAASRRSNLRGPVPAHMTDQVIMAAPEELERRDRVNEKPACADNPVRLAKGDFRIVQMFQHVEQARPDKRMRPEMACFPTMP